MAEPEWPGLNGDENTVEFSVTRMRAIAKEMRRVLSVMNGNGMVGPAAPGERSMTGALQTVQGHTRISSDEIGSWPAAAKFANAVGANTPGTNGQAAPGGNARGFEMVYAKFVSTFEAVVQALEDHAVEYEKSNRFNGG